MVHVGCVLPAFFGTGFAQVSTEFANPGRMLATAGHKRYGHVAHFGAVAGEPDTVYHPVHFLLAQTGISARITGYGASLTGFNTVLELLGYSCVYHTHELVWLIPISISLP